MKTKELLKELRDGIVSIRFTDELTFSGRIINATLDETFYTDKEPTTTLSAPKSGNDPKRVLKVWDTDNDCWVSMQLKYIKYVNGSSVGRNGIVN